MAFLRSMKTSVNYKLKVISRGKKRKHDPWKFHLCWIKQWHPQKQNYNFKQNDFKFQFRLSWVFFSQTILSSTSVPWRKFAGSCFSCATTIVHKTRSWIMLIRDCPVNVFLSPVIRTCVSNVWIPVPYRLLLWIFIYEWTYWQFSKILYF